MQIEPIVVVCQLCKQMKTCTRELSWVDRVWSCALSSVGNQFRVECRRFEPRTGQVRRCFLSADKLVFIYDVMLCIMYVQGRGRMCNVPTKKEGMFIFIN